VVAVVVGIVVGVVVVVAVVVGSNKMKHSGKRKLTRNQIHQIRACLMLNMQVIDIAKRFKVSKATVSRVKLNQTYKDC
jgi:hypothetical protein